MGPPAMSTPVKCEPQDFGGVASPPRRTDGASAKHQTSSAAVHHTQGQPSRPGYASRPGGSAMSGSSRTDEGGKHQVKGLKKASTLSCSQPLRPGHTGRPAAGPSGAQHSAQARKHELREGQGPKGYLTEARSQSQRPPGNPGHTPRPGSSSIRRALPHGFAERQQTAARGSARHDDPTCEAPGQKKPAARVSGQGQPPSQFEQPPGSPGYTVRPGMASAQAQADPASPQGVHSPFKGPKTWATRSIPTQRQLDLQWPSYVSEEPATRSNRGSTSASDASARCTAEGSSHRGEGMPGTQGDPGPLRKAQAASKENSRHLQPGTPLAGQRGRGDGPPSAVRASQGLLSKVHAKHGDLPISELLAMAPQRKRPLSDCMAASAHQWVPPQHAPAPRPGPGAGSGAGAGKGSGNAKGAGPSCSTPPTKNKALGPKAPLMKGPKSSPLRGHTGGTPQCGLKGKVLRNGQGTSRAFPSSGHGGASSKGVGSNKGASTAKIVGKGKEACSGKSTTTGLGTSSSTSTWKQQASAPSQQAAGAKTTTGAGTSSSPSTWKTQASAPSQQAAGAKAQGLGVKKGEVGAQALWLGGRKQGPRVKRTPASRDLRTLTEQLHRDSLWQPLQLPRWLEGQANLAPRGAVPAGAKPERDTGSAGTAPAGPAAAAPCRGAQGPGNGAAEDGCSAAPFGPAFPAKALTEERLVGAPLRQGGAAGAAGGPKAGSGHRHAQQSGAPMERSGDRLPKGSSSPSPSKTPPVAQNSGSSAPSKASKSPPSQHKAPAMPAPGSKAPSQHKDPAMPAPGSKPCGSPSPKRNPPSAEASARASSPSRVKGLGARIAQSGALSYTPLQSKPRQAHPSDTNSPQSKASQSKPPQSKASQSKPPQSKASQSKPPQSKASQSKASQSKPPQSQPLESKASQSKILQSKPPQSQPPSSASASTRGASEAGVEGQTGGAHQGGPSHSGPSSHAGQGAQVQDARAEAGAETGAGGEPGAQAGPAAAGGAVAGSEGEQRSVPRAQEAEPRAPHRSFWTNLWPGTPSPVPPLFAPKPAPPEEPPFCELQQPRRGDLGKKAAAATEWSEGGPELGARAEAEERCGEGGAGTQGRSEGAEARDPTGWELALPLGSRAEAEAEAGAEAGVGVEVPVEAGAGVELPVEAGAGVGMEVPVEAEAGVGVEVPVEAEGGGEAEVLLSRAEGKARRCSMAVLMAREDLLPGAHGKRGPTVGVAKGVARKQKEGESAKCKKRVGPKGEGAASQGPAKKQKPGKEKEKKGKGKADDKVLLLEWSPPPEEDTCPSVDVDIGGLVGDEHEAVRAFDRCKSMFTIMGQLKGQGEQGPLECASGSDYNSLKRRKLQARARERGQESVEIAGLVLEDSGRAKYKSIAGLVGKLDQEAEAQAEAEPEWDPAYADLQCKICSRRDGEEGLLICDGCEGGFHLWCLRPILVTVPPGVWHCPNCRQPEQREEFPLEQTLIHGFFKVQHPRRRPVGTTAVKSTVQGHMEQAHVRVGFKVQVPRQVRVCQGDAECCADPASAVFPVPPPFGCWKKALKKRRKQSLVPHRPTLCATQRLRQMQSLATALTAVGARFSDDLVYHFDANGVAKKMNNPDHEVHEVQDLSPDDLEVFEWCKEMTRRGWGTPLVVKWDPNQGYVVEADGPIPDWSLIAEYAGDVDTLARQLKLPSRQAGDAMMTLLNTGHPRTDLVICPETHANAVRFVSGINNSCRESRKRINCRCVRFNIGGEVRALLIAIKHIATGERLYYDYNGLEQEYPTHNFL